MVGEYDKKQGPKTDEGTTVPLQSEGYTRNRKTMKPQQPQ